MSKTYVITASLLIPQGITDLVPATSEDEAKEIFKKKFAGYHTCDIINVVEGPSLQEIIFSKAKEESIG